MEYSSSYVLSITYEKGKGLERYFRWNILFICEWILWRCHCLLSNLGECSADIILYLFHNWTHKQGLYYFFFSRLCRNMISYLSHTWTQKQDLYYVFFSRICRNIILYLFHNWTHKQGLYFVFFSMICRNLILYLFH